MPERCAIGTALVLLMLTAPLTAHAGGSVSRGNVSLDGQYV
jgi:hypothetical protein